MKHFAMLVMLLAVGLFIVGCGNGDEETKTPPTGPPAKAKPAGPPSGPPKADAKTPADAKAKPDAKAKADTPKKK